MNNNKIAIIDIDNTLWDFATVLYERLYNKLGNIVPFPSKAQLAFLERVFAMLRLSIKQ